jgi:LAO/AO transport system kinase
MADLAERLLNGDKRALARGISLVEDDDPAGWALVKAVYPHTGKASIVGFTGPPGAGKSTLLAQLVRTWRAGGRSVAVLAVDPSSKRSGGALLGDRARIAVDPADGGAFVRSMAAGGRLGGLAPATRAAAHALAAAFDVVVIETVGVGQSETDVAEAADTVAVVVQPAAGDVLQFLKSGIMEIPDVLVVTKADLGAPALAARRDLGAALRSLGARDTPVLAVASVAPATGFDELAGAIDAHRARIDLPARRLAARRASALEDFAVEHGERGLRALGGRREAAKLLGAQDPALDVPALTRVLDAAAAR